MTLISIFSRSSVSHESRIAPEKEMSPITTKVTIITRTEARETVPFLQKLKKPVRMTLLNFVLNISFLISDIIFTTLIVADNFTIFHSQHTLAQRVYDALVVSSEDDGRAEVIDLLQYLDYVVSVDWV